MHERRRFPETLLVTELVFSLNGLLKKYFLAVESQFQFRAICSWLERSGRQSGIRSCRMLASK